MADQYEAHKLIYDITDNAALILSEMSRLSRTIDPENTIPNSLQATLGKVYRYEGKTQSEIAKIYKANKQNTVRYITELEKRGLIFKVTLDNKRKGIYLTDEGRRINEHFMITRGEFLDEALSSIPQKELEITRQTMQKISSILIHHNSKQSN